MNWRTLATVVVAGVALTACDKIPFLAKKKAPADTAQVAAKPAPAATPAAAGTTMAASAESAAAPKPAPKQVAANRAPPGAPLENTPWTPIDTGTVSPGMTRDQVISLWGVPVAERHQANWTYLFFRNGCEATCGTFDVVFLDNGQVVDAIVRGEGHHYAGVSSSPASRKPEVTPPDTAATMPGSST